MWRPHEHTAGGLEEARAGRSWRGCALHWAANQTDALLRPRVFWCQTCLVAMLVMSRLQDRLLAARTHRPAPMAPSPTTAPAAPAARRHGLLLDSAPVPVALPVSLALAMDGEQSDFCANVRAIAARGGECSGQLGPAWRPHCADDCVTVCDCADETLVH
jgi:hypothetical protein